METAGKVSIVIPVYNNEKYVEKCIESVCTQSYQDLEIILVDDGSTDSSGAICDRYAEQDSRIIVLHQENGGVSNARNNGIDMATGEYLTFVDGDDYIGTDYIGDLVKCAQDNQADMVICGLRMVDVDGKETQVIIPGEYIRYEHEEWTFRISGVWAHLYRKELWDKYQVRFYVGERGEDIPIALFFSGVCEKIITLSKADYYYVQHAGSAMANFKGLKKNGLPYNGLETTIQKLQRISVYNSLEFQELFVLRVLATFIQLARGADKQEIDRLARYIDRILDSYYPNYYKNSKARIFSKLDIPLFQKIAVKVLILVKRIRCVSLFLKAVC
ncbi:MAG: glycosyltransferase [Lachnospiraceae bacterium]|nr:glycosyltransferase [Lachnospiraceae bacterium]